MVIRINCSLKIKFDLLRKCLSPDFYSLIFELPVVITQSTKWKLNEGVNLQLTETTLWRDST